MIGPNCTLSTPSHPLVASERIETMSCFNTPIRYCYAKPIVIEDGVWFGANVTVLGGVRIGKNSVIGAGSVVTCDIPENVIAIGTPCKVKRVITKNDSLIL